MGREAREGQVKGAEEELLIVAMMASDSEAEDSCPPNSYVPSTSTTSTTSSTPTASTTYLHDQDHDARPLRPLALEEGDSRQGQAVEQVQGLWCKIQQLQEVTHNVQPNTDLRQKRT